MPTGNLAPPALGGLRQLHAEVNWTAHMRHESATQNYGPINSWRTLNACELVGHEEP